MYKNLLKACALAIFAMGSVESAEGALGSDATKWVDDFGVGQQSNVEATVKAYLDADIFGENSTLKLIGENMDYTPQTVKKKISVSGAKHIKFTSGAVNGDDFVIDGSAYSDKLGFKVTVTLGQNSKTISSNKDCMYELGTGSGAPISQEELVLTFELVDPEQIKRVHPDIYRGTIKVDFSAD